VHSVVLYTNARLQMPVFTCKKPQSSLKQACSLITPIGGGQTFFGGSNSYRYAGQAGQHSDI